MRVERVLSSAILILGFITVLSGSAMAYSSPSFEEMYFNMSGSSSPLQDLSGNKLDGVFYGSPTTDVTGVSKAKGDWGDAEAVSFDGSSGINVSKDSGLDITDNITISAWVKPDTFETWDTNRIVQKTGAYTLNDNSGDLEFYLWGVDSSLKWNGYNSLSTSSYHHLLARYNGTHQSIFVNGTKEVEKTASGSIGTSSESVGIGFQVGAEVNFFKGDIDEPRITSDALTDGEIGDLYSYNNYSFSSNSVPSASFTASTTDLTVDVDASGSSDSDGSISSYEWDWTNNGTYEGSGETASYTYSSEGDYTVKLRVTDNDGASDTATESVSVSESTGSSLGCEDAEAQYHFNESSSPLVDYCNSFDQVWSGGINSGVTGISKAEGDWNEGLAYSFDGSDDYTEDSDYGGDKGNKSISVWFKTTDGDGSIVVKGVSRGGADERDWDLYFANGELRWQTRDGDTGGDGAFINGGTGFDDGNWHHAVGVFNNATDTAEFFVDNSSIGTDNGIKANQHDRISFGGDNSSTGSSIRMLDGVIDEAKIYDRVLTKDEISQLYSTNTLGETTTSDSLSLSVSSPKDGSTQASSVDVSGSTNLDANISVEFNDNGTVLSIANNTQSFSKKYDLDDGSYTANITAEESSNSSNTDFQSVSFTVDSTAPSISSCSQSKDKVGYLGFKEFHPERGHNSLSCDVSDSGGNLNYTYVEINNGNGFQKDVVFTDEDFLSVETVTEQEILQVNTIREAQGFKRVNGEYILLYGTDGGDEQIRWANASSTNNFGNDQIVIDEGDKDQDPGFAKSNDQLYVVHEDGTDRSTSSAHGIISFTEVNDRGLNPVTEYRFGLNEWSLDLGIASPKVWRWNGTQYLSGEEHSDSQYGENSLAVVKGDDVLNWNDFSIVAKPSDFGFAEGHINFQAVTMNKYDQVVGFSSINSADGGFKIYYVNSSMNSNGYPDNFEYTETSMTNVGNVFRKFNNIKLIGHDDNADAVTLYDIQGSVDRNYVSGSSATSSHDFYEPATRNDTDVSWRMCAVDEAGNEACGSENQFTVTSETSTTDTTPPTSSDNWTASSFVDKSSATVEITATDSESSVSNISYRVNGGSYTTVQGSSATVTITEEGDNLLEYYATDSKGNQESVKTEHVALKTIPSVDIESPSNKLYSKINVDLKVFSDEEISEWKYSLDANSNQTFTPNTTFTSLSDSQHTIKVYAEDSAGNIGSSSVDFEVQPLNFNKTLDTFEDGSYSDGDPFKWEKFRDGEIRITDGTLILDHPTNDGSVLSTSNRLTFADCCTGITSHWQVGEAITMNFDAGYMANFDANGEVVLTTKGGTDGSDVEIEVQPVTNEETLRFLTRESSSGKNTDIGTYTPSSSATWTTGFILEDKNPTSIKYFVQDANGNYVVNDTVETSVPADDYVTDGLALDSRGSGDHDISFQVNYLTYKPFVRGNNPPQFNPPDFGIEFLSTDNVSETGSQKLEVGEHLQVNVNSSDPDGNFDNLTATVYKDGSQIFSETSANRDKLFNNVTEISPGTYNATVILRDEEGLTTKDSTVESVTEDAPTINLQNPVDGESHTYLNSESGREINFRADFQDNNQQFDGSYTVYLNDTSIKTESFTSSDWTDNNEIIVDFNDTVSAGTYTYTLNITNSETGNTFDSANQGEANTFTVESVEEQPKFSLNSPVDGSELFFNNNTASSKNVTLKGSVDTSFSGSADVLLDGVKVGGFSVNNGSNSYEEYASVGEGEHSYKVRVTSDDTGNTYESSTTSFNVTGVDEVPPKIGGLKPEGPSYTSDKLDSSFSYNFFVDSEINGTARYYASDGAKELFNITTGKEVDPVNQTFSGSFTIPEEHRYVGFYELVAEVTSEKNNVYTEKIDIYFEPDTEFYNLTPVNETISAENSTSKVVDLSGIVEPSVPGTLEIRVKEPGETSYSTLTSDYYSNVFNENRSFTYSVNFTGIDYPNIVDNKSVSDDYEWKAVYNLNNSFTGSVNDVYSSGPKTLKFSQGAPGFFERQLNLIRNLLKDTVPPAIGLLAVVALIFKTSKETGGDTTTILIVAAASVAGLAYIGFFPLAEYIYGLPGFIGLILLILYLANNLGEVMT